MAMSLQQAYDNCEQLVNQCVQQLTNEGNSDPLSRFSLDKLTSVQGIVKSMMSSLEKEEALFSESADLSDWSLKELNSYVSDIREASRKLSIVLAAGANQFSGQVTNDASALQALQPYLDPGIFKAADINSLVSVVQLSSPNGSICRHRHYTYQCPFGCGNNATGNLPNFTPTNDFTQGATSAATAKKLSQHLSDLAKQFEELHQTNIKHSNDRSKKEQIQKNLVSNLGKLVPMMRRHVLRIGIAKGQHLNISNGCANVSTITRLFDYATVENCHRQLEDGRDRVIQELTLRKLESKMRAETPEKCPAKRRKLENDDK
eukprot:TRINITY_DN25721_c0_g1_i1.p1 TRINITY_DN25721_c0_g1~~TRINITY_DN25721_c0_g1_i1.p1  ORF type:complete len:331 (-),score=53.56 TRINITY_DN25721_c0_g1_i1:195-1148(-)